MCGVGAEGERIGGDDFGFVLVEEVDGDLPGVECGLDGDDGGVSWWLEIEAAGGRDLEREGVVVGCDSCFAGWEVAEGERLAGGEARFNACAGGEREEVDGVCDEDGEGDVAPPVGVGEFEGDDDASCGGIFEECDGWA